MGEICQRLQILDEHVREGSYLVGKNCVAFMTEYNLTEPSDVIGALYIYEARLGFLGSPYIIVICFCSTGRLNENKNDRFPHPHIQGV